jgi:hypothetical protein
VGEIVVDEFFAGALETVCALFEGKEGWVADEDGGVGVVEHGVQVCRVRQEWDVGIAPVVEEGAGVGDGGAAGCVGCDGAELGEGLRGAANEEQGTDAALGGDGAAREDAQGRVGGERGDGDEADVRAVGIIRSGGEAGGALGGGHAVDLIAEGERVAEGRMLEVPHEGRGVEEVDGGDAEAGVRADVHLSL